MVSKDEFLDWKKNPVTIAVFASIVEKINLGATELSYSAGIDTSEDRYKTGMIAAYRDVLEVQLDDVEGASENA